MCGAAMRLSVRQIAEPVPGRPEAVPRPVREGVCPECDYFEEAEGGEQ